jgi:hypothetical protein
MAVFQNLFCKALAVWLCEILLKNLVNTNVVTILLQSLTQHIHETFK